MGERKDANLWGPVVSVITSIMRWVGERKSKKEKILGSASWLDCFSFTYLVLTIYQWNPGNVITEKLKKAKYYKTKQKPHLKQKHKN